jgi:hypothetical protein
MKVELRVTPEDVCIHTVGPQPQLLTQHRRAACRGSWMVDPGHWEGLPNGSKDTNASPDEAEILRPPMPELELLASRSVLARVSVARRDLSTYDQIGALT